MSKRFPGWDKLQRVTAATVPRGTKYHATPSARGALRFASKLEARRFDQLTAMQQAGIVQWFIRQPSFDLGAGVRYIADFLVVAAPEVWIEDVKGAQTAMFRVKLRLFRERYPNVTYKILTKKDINR